MAQSIDPEQITYNQVLQFIDHERSRHIKQQSIAGMLNSLKVYFDFLVVTKVIAQNVFRH
jgi:site-specific recombinase XerD